MKSDPPPKTRAECAISADLALEELEEAKLRDISDFFAGVTRLLRSTSLCNILQSHSKILVVDSRVPFSTCLKSLANYHRNFAFVYDAERMDMAGYIDELSITKFLRSHEEYIGLSCSQFSGAVTPEKFHRLPESVSALEGFEATRRNALNRLFIWSSDRNAPLGYVTPYCYLFYVVKNLRGKYQLLDLPLSHVHVDRNYNKISDEATLREALDALVTHDSISVVDGKGWIMGVLTRQKVNYYALDMIKREEPLVYSTPVGSIIKDMDHKFYHKIQSLNVEPATPIRKAIASIILSNDRVLVYTDENGHDLVVTVWDIIRFLVVN